MFLSRAFTLNNVATMGKTRPSWVNFSSFQAILLDGKPLKLPLESSKKNKQQKKKTERCEMDKIMMKMQR